MRTLVRFLVATLAAGLGTLLLTGTAGAQQIVDAGKQDDGSGGLAFVLMALLVMLIWAALFFMDRIRRRRQESAAE
jgi:membrane protein DedA with SNARE-associated domain